MPLFGLSAGKLLNGTGKPSPGKSKTYVLAGAADAVVIVAPLAASAIITVNSSLRIANLLTLCYYRGLSVAAGSLSRRRAMVSKQDYVARFCGRQAAPSRCF